MAFYASTHSSAAVNNMTVVANSSEEEGLQQAYRELHRLFCLPLPENLSDEVSAEQQLLMPNRDSAAPIKPKPWNHYLKTSKKKRVSWQDDAKQTPRTLPSLADDAKPTTTAAPPTIPTYTLPPPPETWPQRRHLIRATPGSSTQIVGIRYSDESESLSKDPFWEKHSAVPINTGKEGPGQSIVVDFISTHFVGTVLFRIRGVQSAIDDDDDSEQQEDNPDSYFAKRQRTFQGVVRGRFRNNLPMAKCITGQTFRRPAGTLPAHWIIFAIEAVIKRLAPENELHLEGSKPRYLMPVVTAAQTLQVKSKSANDDTSTDDQGLVRHDGQFFYDSAYDSYNAIYTSNSILEMEQDWQEPHATHHRSLVHQVNSQDAANSPSVLDNSKKNQKFRKSYFNKHLSERWQETEQEENAYHFTTDKEYMFEFYEHMVIFDRPELSLDLKVPLLRHIPIAPCTDGQPMQFMSAVRQGGGGDLEFLWNFEVWHESLYPLASQGEERHQKQQS